MAAPTNIWYTNIASPAQAGGQNTLANLDDPSLTSGRISLITATYTMTGNEVANDAVYIARVPSGALVSPILSNMAPQAIATTATMSIGDTDTVGGTVAYDPARYSAAQDIHALNSTTGVAFSGGTVLTAVPSNPVSGAAGITDDWVWLLGTFATLGTPVANKTITFRILVVQMD
jgi:hypothetical protein